MVNLSVDKVDIGKEVEKYSDWFETCIKTIKFKESHRGNFLGVDFLQ